MSEIKRPWTAGPWEARTDHEYGANGLYPVWYVHTPCNRVGIARQPAFSETARGEANARLISAAPEMAEALLNFEIKGPDADGLVWLILHGRGTTGKGMLQIGHADTLIAQVAVSLEGDRLAALRKAGIEGV